MSTDTAPEATEPTVIEIQLPLPSDVVTTLTGLIASAYPKATFTERAGFHHTLAITLPPGSRPRPFRKKTAPARASEVSITEAGPGRFGVEGSAEVTRLLAEVVHQSFVDHPEVKAYLEMRLRYRENVYLVTFARGVAQTPQVLHMAAERRARQAEARLGELTAVDVPVLDRVAMALARQKYEAELDTAAAAAAAAGRDLTAVPWDDLGERRRELAAAEEPAAAAALAAMGVAGPAGVDAHQTRV